MSTASNALATPDFTASIGPAIIRRRRLRPLLRRPRAATPGVALALPTPGEWQRDLRFFVGCYVAGLAFFLIMLS